MKKRSVLFIHEVKKVLFIHEVKKVLFIHEVKKRFLYPWSKETFYLSMK